MADRKLHLGLRTVMFAGTLGIAGGAACFAVENQNENEKSPPPSVHALRVTPTPTETPLILESTYRKLTPTEVPTPFVTEEAADLPTAVRAPGQSFTNPSVSTYRPIWTPTSAPTPAVPVVTFAPTAEPQSTPEQRYRYDVADEIFTRINDFRAQNGEFALIRDEDLDEAARAYAKNYYENGDYSHATHDLGGNPLERANKVSTEKQWMGIAEVINIGSNSADAVMTVWINSAPHYAAILSFPNNGDFDRRYQYLGTGCFEGPNVRQGFPNITVAVCVGSIGFPVPTPTVTEVQ